MYNEAVLSASLTSAAAAFTCFRVLKEGYYCIILFYSIEGALLLYLHTL
jgi:hypothetical protein